MRRRRRNRTGIHPTLFPFLAVLICTMGVMIVLLVLGVQQAQVDARVIVENREQNDKENRKVHQQQLLEREDFLWRSQVLVENREKKTQELADTRLALGHLEEHIRQIVAAGEELLARQQFMGNATPAGEVEEVRRQIAQLVPQVQRARQALLIAREQLAASEQSFSIIPYQGPYGTRRYPVYVECTPQGVVIQPEGVLITLDDLSRLSGPGNPLDACLRTVREYLVSTAGHELRGDPYPLLVVRPDSVVSYAFARRAMKSWEDAFGYELIDSDIKLTYPSADQTLARQLEKTIRDARQRQLLLAAAMPSQFGSHRGEMPAGRSTAAADTPTGNNQVVRNGSRVTNPSSTAAHPPANARPEGTGGRQAEAGVGIAGRETGWALPRKNVSRTGVTRPLYVTCHDDRLIIVPRRGERGRVRTVHLEGPLVDNIDSFVSEIWDHMEGWGIAVAGGYWRPVLKVDVRPGGATRFAELGRLLKDSGIVVQQYR